MNTTGAALSRFTPSLLAPEVLERLFVARGPLLSAVMQRIEAAATSTERNHTLLVGPRGAGKTHLVSLAYHRAKRRQSEGLAISLAWLAEDPWTLVTYRHLLVSIVNRLEPAAAGDTPKAAPELEAVLSRHAAAHGPVVVFVENLDQILANLEDLGQQQLRHLLQAERSLLLVATTTSMDRSFSDQASPFYGFFTTSRLEPFDVDEAATMLQQIAKERGDDRLVEYLDSDEGRSRLQTIAHLAGGQPRMWAALASALTVERLDDLVELLLTRFDDLTPYYQERLGRLSGQQRLVVAELAEADHPLHVAELAQRLDLDQRSVGKTMSELVEKGWAAPTTSPITLQLDQRRTYYELAEPLARLSFQIKDSRGEPLRLIVDFLKMWFDPADLAEAKPFEAASVAYLELTTLGHTSDGVLAVTRQLQGLPETDAPTLEVLGLVDDALSTLQHGDPAPFLCLPTSLRSAVDGRLRRTGTDLDQITRVRRQIHRLAQTSSGLTPSHHTAGWLARSEDLVATASAETAPWARLDLAEWLALSWRFGESAAVLDASAEALGPDHPGTLTRRSNLALIYWAAGRTDDAITLNEAVLADSERILGPDHANTLTSRSNLANCYLAAGRTDDAITLNEAVLADRERILGPDHPGTLTSRNNLANCYLAAGRTDDALTLNEAVLADRERILGPDHPDTLISRNNLANCYWHAGRTDDAITLHEVVLASSERILGPDHANTLTSRNNLATCYRHAGRPSEALALFEAVLADRERILGPDHPDTAASRKAVAELASTGGDLG